MKNFTRSTLAILIFFSVSIILSSCGNKESNNTNTIKFWHFWSEPNQQKVLKEMVSDFEKANNCKIEISELSWGDGKTKLFAAFNSNTAPDVVELGSDWVAQFSASNVLDELNPDSLNMNRFVESCKEPSYWQNKLYVIPWVINSRVLFYNKDLLKRAGLGDKAPETIDQMIDFAERIQALGNETYGFGTNGSDPHRLYKKIMPFIWTYGGNIFENSKLVINSLNNAQAFDAYLKLSRVGIIETQKKIDDMFARGNVGLWISGTWLVDKIKNTNPNLNYGVALFPGINGKTPGVSFAGGEYLGINKNSKNKALAQKFIKFLTDGQNALKFCKNVSEAGFPADKSTNCDNYFMSNPILKIFADQLNYSKMTPVQPKWLDIEAALENALTEALYGKKGAQEALNEVQMQIQGGGNNQ